VASIRVRPRKNRPPTYCIRWRDPDQAGKEVSLTFDDRRQAEQFLKILNDNKGHLAPTAAVWNAVQSKSPSIADTLETHIASIPSITSRGRADYRRDARIHINPHIGSIPVDAFTEAHAKQFLTVLGDTKISDKTIRNVHGLLSAAISTAIKAGHRTANPCIGIRLPRRDEHDSTEMIFLTPGQWESIDTELPNYCDGYYRLLFRTLAWTGMRWGEAAALQVGDLSLAATPPTVRISRALRRDEHSRPYVGPTKTKRSKRTISLRLPLADEMRAHVKGKPPGSLVFESHTGTALHHSNIRNRAWVPACTAAMAEKYGENALTEVPRIHDLRHSHASWLFGAGLDLLAVQRRLGHESITTTADRYGHLLPEQQLAVSAALDRLFS
jgi:integrase